ncbi:MAG: hypothetical protein AAGG69_14605 [Pseudomonadota bacterium]
MLKTIAKYISVSAVSAAFALSLTSIAVAQTQQQSCGIIVQQDGRMAASADTTVLSTSISGGEPARVAVDTTNSQYALFVDTPLGFAVAPANGSVNTNFLATYSGRGATEFLSKQAGIETRLKNGRTNLEIDFEARKLNGSFPSGNYRAGVTVRCE